MKEIKSWLWYKNLQVWQKAMQLSEDFYLVTRNFPKTETYWLVDQMKRASVSVASNIAEWNMRWGQKEFIHFLYIAKWSLAELETQTTLAYNLKFLLEEDYKKLEEEMLALLKMLSSFINTLKKSELSYEPK